jgi:hypothetical protein
MRDKSMPVNGHGKAQPGLFIDILNYLIGHPEARDTVEGIAQWWLLEQNIKEQLSQVQAVLDDLVAMGLILEQEGSDLRPNYRINSSRVDEIKKLLDRQGEEKEILRH